MKNDLASLLEEQGPAISGRVIREMYAEPFWEERYGDRGRKPASQDGDFHVRYLVEALRAGSPSTMIEYARWLRTVLTSRGMCSRHLADNFARLGRALRAELGEEVEPAVDYLRRAEGALRHAAGPAREVEEQEAALAERAASATIAAYPGAEEAWRARWIEDALHLLSYLADGLAGQGDGALADYIRILARVHARRGEPAEARDRLLDALENELDAAGVDLFARALLVAARRAAEVSR